MDQRSTEEQGAHEEDAPKRRRRSSPKALAREVLSAYRHLVEKALLVEPLHDRRQSGEGEALAERLRWQAFAEAVEALRLIVLSGPPRRPRSLREPVLGALPLLMRRGTGWILSSDAVWSSQLTAGTDAAAEAQSAIRVIEDGQSVLWNLFQQRAGERLRALLPDDETASPAWIETASLEMGPSPRLEMMRRWLLHYLKHEQPRPSRTRKAILEELDPTADWPTMKQAAIAVRVSPSTILRRCEEGTLMYVGDGVNRRIDPRSLVAVSPKTRAEGKESDEAVERKFRRNDG